MIERYTQKKLTWIDLKEPTTKEVREVMDECSIPPELLGDLTKPVPRSGITPASGAIKITLDFPVVKRSDLEDGAHEIKFIITKTHLITGRYEDITALHKFAKEFEVVTVLEKGNARAHGGHLFAALMRTLYG